MHSYWLINVPSRFARTLFPLPGLLAMVLNPARPAPGFSRGAGGSAVGLVRFQGLGAGSGEGGSETEEGP
ncbi:hypothetical protein GCM10009827_006140 [Dactylosporangium maewongense]|uniref:Uncharacterized protein n=1 Tax=Dactylosporangium maewongense TaxID=634393 RepID=A0ABP4KAB6_9ACTN